MKLLSSTSASNAIALIALCASIFAIYEGKSLSQAEELHNRRKEAIYAADSSIVSLNEAIRKLRIYIEQNPRDKIYNKDLLEDTIILRGGLRKSSSNLLQPVDLDLIRESEIINGKAQIYSEHINLIMTRLQAKAEPVAAGQRR